MGNALADDRASDNTTLWNDGNLEEIEGTHHLQFNTKSKPALHHFLRD